ncbi:TPA: glycosyl transferase [Candidatus Moranbacteria bacterium]|nr:glycosyl transferase [Candidatus Moranbacteria bacterium]
MGSIKYSFIIPVKEINDYIRESIPKILEISRDDYEIIIYPDHGFETAESWPKTKQIPSGFGPAIKRNLAIRDAQGDFLVFVDDDAYPRKDILDILDKDFVDENIAAVGGPAITPESNSFLQKVSGAVFLSYFSGGFPERYAPVGKKRFVCDWPTVNLTVRKKAFLQTGGFDCKFWPGEDTKFCLDIIQKIKEKNKILYDPAAIVWHHRREGLLRHLKQVGSYGIHRGFFAKKYPKTSFKFRYFIPSVFFLFVFFGWALGYAHPLFFKLYILGWIFYDLAMLKVFYDITKYQKNILVALYALVYVFLTHLSYGAKFIQGFLFTRELKSKFR